MLSPVFRVIVADLNDIGTRQLSGYCLKSPTNKSFNRQTIKLVLKLIVRDNIFPNLWDLVDIVSKSND